MDMDLLFGLAFTALWMPVAVTELVEWWRGYRIKLADWWILGYVLWVVFFCLFPTGIELDGLDLSAWLAIAPTMIWFFSVVVFGVLGHSPPSRGPGGEQHWAGGSDGGE